MSDPRVVTPAADEPDVVISGVYSGNGQAYHTEPESCSTVAQMARQTTVSLSVAEWKGYHECHRCAAIRERRENPAETEGPTRSPIPTCTADACRDLRERVADGMTITRLIACLPWGRDRIRTHLLGECDHDHPDTPPLANGWHIAPDPPTPRDGHPRVSGAECNGVRRRLLSGMCVRDIGTEMNMSKPAVRRHARGKCSHDVSMPALQHGWHPAAVGGERVFVASNDRSRYGTRIYHTDRDCPHLNDAVSFVRDALDDQFRECRQCADADGGVSAVGVADD